MSVPFIEVRGIRKRFPGVLALDNVTARVFPGEVLAIVGENGAGKSTLMKILAGIYLLDAGSMLVEGRAVRFHGVGDALRAGISLIHQELNLAENLSVAANIFLGHERRGFFGGLRNATMDREARTLLKRVGLAEGLVNERVEHLAPGQKQLVEIARALSLAAKLIIMDEPTSSLTQGETDRLYEVIDGLRGGGVAIVYISHRLAEVKRVADRATVLRDGRNAGELDKADINHDALIKLMVGRDLKQVYPRKPEQQERPPLLTLHDVRYDGGPAHGVSLTVGAGEIVGMAGLVGAGRTELAEAVFGLRRQVAGRITLAGRHVRATRPARAMRAGMVMVPEDRRLNGLILEESISFNLSLPNLDALSVLRFVRHGREQAMGRDMVSWLHIKTPSLAQTVGLLSGGNQQKVVLGKWLARGPKLLILDEPTRGVDVGARGEIYSIIDQLAASGVGIWMISSDMEEVLGMSDRIVVLHEGRVAGELPRSRFSEEAVMRLATGAGAELC